MLRAHEPAPARPGHGRGRRRAGALDRWRRRRRRALPEAAAVADGGGAALREPLGQRHIPALLECGGPRCADQRRRVEGGLGPAATSLYYSSLMQSAKEGSFHLEMTIAHVDMPTMIDNFV